jgi:hypothetical protein
LNFARQESLTNLNFMQIYKKALPAIELKLLRANAGTDKSLNAAKRVPGHDIIQNIDLKDALIRFGITILLPIIALLISGRLVILTTPIMIYLFATAITRYCVIKYMWRRYISHKSTLRSTVYGQDPNYPEESV